MKPLTPARIRAAWLIAIAVDAIQIGISITGPLGFLVDAPLDLVAMALLWWLLGWHWALLPSFVFELLPIADMAPTWTLAVWIVTRRRKAQI
jgi:hypothetical protein